MLSSVRLSVDIGFISFRFYSKSEELHISQCDLIRIIPLLFDSNRQLSTIGFFCPSLKKKYVLFLLFIITLRGEIQSISSLWVSFVFFVMDYCVMFSVTRKSRFQDYKFEFVPIFGIHLR